MEMNPFSPQQIKKAALELSKRYREGQKPYLRTVEDRHAYLVTRLPATQAALRRVFEELKEKPLYTYLDIGAGPGASWEPAQEVWPMLEKATFVELDSEFVRLGKKLLQNRPIEWKLQSATHLEEMPIHDLVLFSYSWGEIKSPAVLQRAWNLCRQFLVIVEPGTPRGYEAMLEARDSLVAQGGVVFSPCPHSQKCPWQGTREWCHFAIRLERSREHQWAKEGSLGYEDEKFSYVIVSKTPPDPFFGRLVKDPLKRKGHTLLTLCTKNGIETKIISKKQKDLFKMVNKSKWGDKIREVENSEKH